MFVPIAAAAVALSGTATLSFPPGVSVAPTGKAKRVHGDYRLPVRAQRASGPIRLKGGLRLKRGGRQVRLTGLEVETKRITARVDGVLRRKVFVVPRAKVSETPATTRIVARLKSAPGLRLGGRTVRGRIDLKATRKSIRLVGGRTELRLDPAFRDTLSAELITPAGGEGSPITEDGAIALPISRGRVSSRRLEGTVDHAGGIFFSKSNTTSLRLEDYLLDTRSNIMAGRINDTARVDLFTVVLPKPSLEGDLVTFADATAALTATAAEAFNTAFDSTAFSEGQPFATLTVLAEAD